MKKMFAILALLSTTCWAADIVLYSTVPLTPAPMPKTGQTNSYATLDDGGLKVGVAWPNPRFSVVGAVGTAETNQIRDNLTGLIWARDANMFGVTNWGAAVTNCNSLTTYGGTNDWRLPNCQELRNLIDASKSNPALPTDYLLVFSGVKSLYYWSSTTYAGNALYAWSVGLLSGDVSGLTKVTAYYVWPVRGGQ